MENLSVWVGKKSAELFLFYMNREDTLTSCDDVPDHLTYEPAKHNFRLSCTILNMRSHFRKLCKR